MRTPPLLPPDRRGRAADPIYRAAAVHVRSTADNLFVDDAVKELGYADDRATQRILKSAVQPAKLTTDGWAGDNTSSAVSELISSLPACAGAQLISRGSRVQMTGYGGVVFPSVLPTADAAGGFVPEGGPIPVGDLSILSGLLLQPRKFAIIVAMTREMTEGSAGFENGVRQVLTQACALKLDAKLFSADADDGVSVAGILNGVTPVSASSASGQEAFIEDIATLVGALETAGGGVTPAFIASPTTAAKMKLWAPAKFDYPILASTAVTADSVIAVETSSFVSAFSPVPEISASNETALHFDTAATDIVQAGSPATSGRVKSLLQVDCIALKLVVRCAWGMRAAGHVQIVNSVVW